MSALLSWRACLGVAMFAMALSIPAHAQVEDIEAPITATATPVMGVPGTVITLAGETPPAQANAKVKIVISLTPTPKAAGSQSAAPVQYDVLIDAKGRWAFKVTKTASIGRYSVAVVAPDGKGQAKTQFDIVGDDGYEKLAQQSVLDMQASLAATETALVGHMKALIKALPDSPEKQETERRFEAIERRTEIWQFPDPIPPVVPGIPTFERARAMAPIIETVRSITAESDRVRQAVKASRFGAETCQRLDTLIEALNFTSSLTNFLASRKDIIINHLTDKLAPAGIEENKQSNAGAKFAQAESFKVVVATMRKGQNLVNSVPGLALDLLNYVTKVYYGKVCTRFEGPFTGSLSIDFYTNSSSRDAYWSYTVRIGGMMSLSQPKAFDDKAGSMMLGRVDGAAMGYDVTEDTLKLIPAMRGQLIYHKLIAPNSEIPLPPLEMGALFNTMMHPLGFQATVRAVRKGDQVVVNFDDAPLRDMDPKFNRALLIHVFNGGLIPVLNYQTLPMQGGHYILTRGMRKDAVLKLTTQGSEQHLSNKFTREEDTGDVRLRWNVEVDICNPACSTTTFGRIKSWYDAGQARRKKAQSQ